jgi:tetratricopeptide (TPR) repeat protein
MNRFQEAKEALTKVLEHSLRFGSALGTPARTLLAVVTIAEGRLAQGFKILERIQKEYLTNGNKCLYVMGEYLIGKIYAQFSAGSPAQIPLIRNLGFILRNLPFAHRRAQEHLGRSVAVAEEIGARCMAGMGYLDLGLFHAATGKRTLSRDCLTKARDLFEQCEAEVYLKQAKEALESLDGDYS